MKKKRFITGILISLILIGLTLLALILMDQFPAEAASCRM